MTTTEFHAFPDRDAMMDRATSSIVDSLRQRLSAAGKATIVASGGRTPRPIYEKLSSIDLDWARVTVSLSDDRQVPANSPYSNAKLVRETLLTKNAAAAAFVALIPGVVRPARLPFDLILLGMGEDGHTASLFPGAPGMTAALDPAGEPQCIRVTPDPLPAEAPYPRLTLNLAALLASRTIILLLTGETKRRVYERALQPGPAEGLPVRGIINQGLVPVTVFWAP